MAVFGKSLSQYIEFQKGFLILIALVGIARPVLAAAGVPNSVVSWVSVTGLLVIGCLVYSVRVHTSGFGSYKQILPVLFVQNVLAGLIIGLAVVLAIVTMQDNVYSFPEFSGGVDGKNWTHALAHIFIVPIVLSLVLWGLGSLILLVTKKMAPRAS